MKSTILTSLALCCAGLTTNAAVLATPSFDTYSYVFLGNSYSTAPNMNVTEYYGTSSGMYASHFFFSLVQFDVSSLSLSGTKNLLMKASGYTDGTMGGDVTENGTYTINVGVMPESFTAYQEAGDRLTWFDDNILSLTPVGTMTFTDQTLASLDVTSAVNNWIDNENNYGFVLWSENIGSVEIFTSDSSGFSPQLNSTVVPEPQTYAMIGGILVLGMAVIHRRRK